MLHPRRLLIVMGVVHPPAKRHAKGCVGTNVQWTVVELAKTHVSVVVQAHANIVVELPTLVVQFVGVLAMIHA